MSLNPLNQEKEVRLATTALNMNISGIVTIAGPLRFPRYVEAEYTINGGGFQIGGGTVQGTPLSKLSSSGMPMGVQVLNVSGIYADIQFLGSWSGSFGSGIGSATDEGGPRTLLPMASGSIFSGGTLFTTWRGD